MTPRKAKKPQARYSFESWKRRKATWSHEEIGSIVKVSGLFLEARVRAPYFPRFILVPEVSALVTGERTCRILSCDETTDYIPVEWSKNPDPKAKEFITKNFLVDLSALTERVEETIVPQHTDISYRLV